MRPVRRNTTLRWNEAEGWLEYLCGDCSDAHKQAWWPLTDEFWNQSAGFQRCRSCWTTHNRAARTRRPIPHEEQLARNRRYYREARPVILLKRRLRYQENREAILAEKRAAYHARKAA